MNTFKVGNFIFNKMGCGKGLYMIKGSICPTKSNHASERKEIQKKKHPYPKVLKILSREH